MGITSQVFVVTTLIATFALVSATAQAQNVLQLNSEGSELQFGQLRYRLELFIQGKAGDGMDINRYYNFDWVNPSDAPDDLRSGLAKAQPSLTLSKLCIRANWSAS